MSYDFANVFSVAVDGRLVGAFIQYDLADTPCENVVGKKACSCASGVADLFPRDLMLRHMGVEGRTLLDKPAVAHVESAKLHLFNGLLVLRLSPPEPSEGEDRK